MVIMSIHSYRPNVIFKWRCGEKNNPHPPQKKEKEKIISL